MLNFPKNSNSRLLWDIGIGLKTFSSHNWCGRLHLRAATIRVTAQTSHPRYWIYFKHEIKQSDTMIFYICRKDSNYRLIINNNNMFLFQSLPPSPLDEADADAEEYDFSQDAQRW